MSKEYYTNKKEAFDIKTIILGHYKKILEISCREFTAGYWNISVTREAEHKTYFPDSREEYIQSVEALANALYPFFDEHMKKIYIKFQREEEKLTEQHSNNDGFVPKTDNIYSIKKLRFIKILFRELSALLHRLDYLKSGSYSEGDLDDEFVDIDGDKK